MSKQHADEMKEVPTCFVIMPIADTDGYEKGHFRKVYEDIFKVACEKSGYKPVRADDVKQTNLIQLDILQKLIDSPMAICDLSSRNPNVLFELGLRQAFDKPTVLVQEQNTPKIFDISPLRYTEYRQSLRYREVLEDQLLISEAIKTTKEASEKGEGINSIVSLLSLSSPAALKDVTDNDSIRMMQVVMSEINSLRSDFKKTILNDSNIQIKEQTVSESDESRAMYNSVSFRFIRLKRSIENKEPIDQVKNHYDRFVSQALQIKSYPFPAKLSSGIEKRVIEADRLFSNYLTDNL